ncbi:MAG: type I-C CRISPR-associated protein Cas5c [Galactobacillus timonensis]|uniref:type I-C CRISPR-associated protein Cas5c n=1 Tax=Galactobacillus timonensis TaxID=2041840 RepID=UPI0024099CCF|nr:type I-C CRISPR-associated protein Cas5c [Galactobacillus timonensis]MDD5852110.1 type I-C CRISPR-associated protein Cas5c [Galactobacillus timonensis]MDD6600502.1 type I-C CRISPR-associated protein Cas5c [Galactobacillus timonensis]
MFIENKLFVEIWGDRALFTRPELKAERYSYDVITPSAARNILEAIYWHPGCNYIIDRIYLLSKHNNEGFFNCKENPIKMVSVKRNEVGEKGSANNVKRMMDGGPAASIDASDKIQQRNSVLLKDVHYVIEAHIKISEEAHESDNIAKYLDIFTRRCKKGQCFHQPYLGCREFICNFAWWDNPRNIPCVDLSCDFGLMLFDQEYPAEDSKGGRKAAIPVFYRAKMDRGVIQVEGAEVYR